MSTIVVRSDVRPGDVVEIVRMHGAIYEREHGFDRSFETYVEGPLAAFAERTSARERLWIAESGGRLVGCVAIVDAGDGVAQLRWFLVAPDARGRGLGGTLLHAALAFAAEAGYATIVLFTVSTLIAAARLYAAAGFVRVEERPGRMWGVDVVEERYELRLADNPGSPPRSGFY